VVERLSKLQDIVATEPPIIMRNRFPECANKDYQDPLPKRKLSNLNLRVPPPEAFRPFLSCEEEAIVVVVVISC